MIREWVWLTCVKLWPDAGRCCFGGDSANDAGMLKAAGLGCCMANGSDDAREAADRIIGDVREDGLAALIEELWFNGPRAESSGHELGSPWGQMEAAEEKQ